MELIISLLLLSLKIHEVCSVGQSLHEGAGAVNRILSDLERSRRRSVFRDLESFRIQAGFDTPPLLLSVVNSLLSEVCLCSSEIKACSN